MANATSRIRAVAQRARDVLLPDHIVKRERSPLEIKRLFGQCGCLSHINASDSLANVMPASDQAEQPLPQPLPVMDRAG